MRTTSTTRCRSEADNAKAASWLAALILAAMLLGITAFPTRADCNPSGAGAAGALPTGESTLSPQGADRIDARCYSDLQGAAAAAIAANVPLWLPAGTYTLDRELVIDYAPLAATGFQIISDGAIIDATATGQRAMTIECSGGTPDNSKGCFYFHIQGTLFVNANTSQAAVRFGLNDFSDAHNSAKIDHLIVNNAGSGYAVRLNYILNADIFTVAVTAGSAGLVMDQVQFSKISGAASATAGTAMLIQNGYTFSNTISAIDLEVARTCLAITSPSAVHNTFVSPYFVCPTAVAASSGASNLLFNPLYGSGTRAPAPGSQTGILTLP
jgi:hypothetical protein